MKKIAIVGSRGQLGTELQLTAPNNCDTLALSREQLDIVTGDLTALEQYRPDVVINAAAYTAVDKAEDDSSAAFASNCEAVKNLGEFCAAHHTRLIHISTDFVFDGKKNSPYLPTDTLSPQSIYGESKAGGEAALAAIAELNYLIIRTSWVYSAYGNNFVKTMLRLFAERPSLGVVKDQLGSPTWAKNLARVIWRFIETSDCEGIYHYSDQGIISWYEFACAIEEESQALGWPAQDVVISAIPASDYPTPAQRPSYSALDCQSTEAALQLERQPWRDALRAMLKELRHEIQQQDPT